MESQFIKDPVLQIGSLLPIRAVVVTLEFIATGQPRFFHQAALSAFLKYLAGSPEDYDCYIRIDACESSRIHYRSGDYYRFLLIGLNGSDTILRNLLSALKRLPHSAIKQEEQIPFRDNLRLYSLQDAFSESAITHYEELSQYNSEQLAQEAALWREHGSFKWCWLSPVRLLKEKTQREHDKGEARYCRDAIHVTAPHLMNRTHDSLADLLRRRGESSTPVRSQPPIADKHTHNIFWVDTHYTDAKGTSHVMGGMTGESHFHYTQPFSLAWWRLLLIGQFTGIGQRTAFGWGRYQLITPEDNFTFQRPLPAASHLMFADTDENLANAWRHIMSNCETAAPNEEQWLEIDEVEEEEIITDAPLEQLHRQMQALLKGQYSPPKLKGHLMPKKNGGVRPLAVPPFNDRVLQRAISQIINPAIEQLMYEKSHGYRLGRSRISASYDIQAAWRAGYRWVYESDIKDFFDNVDLNRLKIRLQALYGEDPLIDCIINWMKAPVQFRGETIERQNGLPQGSPLSPLMANLMLDDFDSDMREAGFHLVRFADDFIVLCKDPEEARAADAKATASLAEHGLSLNLEKTGITAMDKGFRYLGYLFVNDMALDTSNRILGSEQIEQLPSNSWLAHIGAREPNPLQRGQDLETLIKQISKQQPLTIGDRENRGTLLCITGTPCRIVTRDKHLQALREDKLLYNLPWHSIECVILFGNHQITTQAMQAALRTNTPIHLANTMGDYQGVIWTGRPAAQGHQLWLQQIANFSDEDNNLYLAREVVGARLRHMKESLRQRHKSWDSQLLDNAIKNINKTNTLESLRGHEGCSTKEFFRRMAEILPEEFVFNGRNRRPPRDPVNALLSLGYTLLYGYSESILRSIGFLPWCGFYHQPHGRHAVLASDLMEPFRHIIERTVMSTILRGEIKPEAFSYSPAGACHIEANARRKYLALLTQQLETPVRAKGAEQAEKIQNHIYNQALSLREWILRGTPFKAWRTR